MYFGAGCKLQMYLIDLAATDMYSMSSNGGHTSKEYTLGDIIAVLRSKINGELFDYPFLMDVLHEYKKPRDLATRLLSMNTIVRIKKGLYCFGKPYRHTLR